MYTSSPSSSVTLQRFGHLAAPVEPITGAKDLSVIRNPTSRWNTQFPNGNTVWEPSPINFRRGSLWNDETVVVPVSSNSYEPVLWVFILFPCLENQYEGSLATSKRLPSRSYPSIDTEELPEPAQPFRTHYVWDWCCYTFYFVGG